MLIDPRAIRSSIEFSHILQELKRATALGEMRQIHLPQSALFEEIFLKNIPDEGPWPDYVEIYFEEASTGDAYKLTVETYHGAGGSWQKISRDV